MTNPSVKTNETSKFAKTQTQMNPKVGGRASFLPVGQADIRPLKQVNYE